MTAPDRVFVLFELLAAEVLEAEVFMVFKARPPDPAAVKGRLDPDVVIRGTERDSPFLVLELTPLPESNCAIAEPVPKI